MYLTVGDWFNRLPGVLTSVDLSWQKDYTWEIAIDRQFDDNEGKIIGKDKNMLVLPHVLDVSVNFLPIHSFAPNNSPTAPFIGIDGGALQLNTTEVEDSNSDTDWRLDAVQSDIPIHIDGDLNNINI